jgi:hypothetical protein
MRSWLKYCGRSLISSNGRLPEFRTGVRAAPRSKRDTPPRATTSMPSLENPKRPSTRIEVRGVTAKASPAMAPPPTTGVHASGFPYEVLWEV